MSKFGRYSGADFKSLHFSKRGWIIEGIIRERDSVIVVGGEKSGKSILIKQLICSLTAKNQPFLQEYKVKKACKVTYVQIEGEIEDTVDRFNRMTEAIEYDFSDNKFQVLYKEPMNLRDKVELRKLIKEIEEFHIPDVIIIDPLYFAFFGKMTDDDIVRAFLGNIRILKEHFGCTIIIVHHTHRAKFDLKGKAIDEGDEAIFGSGSLKWWADHIILFQRDKKTELRYFSCLTQRGGDIVKNLTLELVEPYPLYFKKSDLQIACPSQTSSIFKLLELHDDGLSKGEVMEKLAISKSTFYFCVEQLMKEKLIIKTDPKKRPVKYKIRGK